MIRNKIYKFIALSTICLTVFFTVKPFVFAQDASETKSKKMGLFANEIISIDELKKQLKSKNKPLILDARDKKSFDESHIRGAKLPLSKSYYNNQELFRKGIIKMLPEPDGDLAKTMQKYKKDLPIVTYCNDDCQASAVLVLKLKKIGFKNVKALDEGIQTWKAKGGQVTSNADPRIPSKV